MGPYTAEELRSWLDAGSITPEWSAWKEGLPAWSPIGAIPELSAPPPPLPPPPAPAPVSSRPVAEAPQARATFSAPAKKTVAPKTSAGAGAGVGAILIMAIAGVIGRGIGGGAADFLCRASLGPPKEFTSDGGFTIRIPSSHEVSTQRQPVPGTTSSLTMHTGIDQRSPYAFAAGWMDIPSDANFDFEGGMQGAVQNMNGTVLTKTNIFYQGSPGREFTFKGQNEGHDVSGIARIYLIRRRTVMLIFFKLGHDATNPPAARAFLDSFAYRGG